MPEVEERQQIISREEFLILKVMASEQFRGILEDKTRREPTMEDIRKVVMGSVCGPSAVVSARWFPMDRSERWEKVRSYVSPALIPVEYTLVHTVKRAPDGKKFVVFLEKVEQLMVKPK